MFPFIPPLSCYIVGKKSKYFLHAAARFPSFGAVSKDNSYVVDVYFSGGHFETHLGYHPNLHVKFASVGTSFSGPREIGEQPGNWLHFVMPSRTSYTILNDDTTIPYGQLYWSAKAKKQLGGLSAGMVSIAQKVGSHERQLEKIFSTLVDISNRIDMLERTVARLIEEEKQGEEQS